MNRLGRAMDMLAQGKGPGVEAKPGTQADRPVFVGHAGQSVAAMLALLLAALPAALTAVVIFFSLGRPLLFRQVRSGLGQRPFTVVKFRTMHDRRDADGELLPDDRRETRVTRFIRRLRLDEIPQLLSILSGDMSFVGPRPLQPDTVAAFGTLGHVRASVRPGLTGWAQVNGNTRLTDREKLALDIWYVDHRSRSLDARILLLTVVVMLRGERIHAKALRSAQAHLAMRSDAPAGDSWPAGRNTA